MSLRVAGSRTFYHFYHFNTSDVWARRCPVFRPTSTRLQQTWLQELGLWLQPTSLFLQRVHFCASLWSSGVAARMWEGVRSWLGVGDAEAAKQQEMDRTTSGEAWVSKAWALARIPHIGGLYFVCSPYLQ